jgi:hypothetical protein
MIIGLWILVYWDASGLGPMRLSFGAKFHREESDNRCWLISSIVGLYSVVNFKTYK